MVIFVPKTCPYSAQKGDGGEGGGVRGSHQHPTGITGMPHHQNYEITACHAGLEIRLMFWSDIARTQYKTLWSCMGNFIGHFNNLVGKCPMTSCYF